MSQNPHDHLDMFQWGQLSGVVGGIAQRNPSDGGGTTDALPGLHHSDPFQQSAAKKCGAPKFFGNPGKGAFLGSSAWASLANGVPVTAPIAVCPWVPKLVNK
jgi:hypothetical protein